MRLAVISDIHSNLPALQAVLADIATRGVDATINLGDCVAGPLWPSETWECLRAEAMPTVRGNHDRWLYDRAPERLPPVDRFALTDLSAAQCLELFQLPATIDLSAEVLAVHGTPTDDSTYLTEETVNNRMTAAQSPLIIERLATAMHREVILCGHSHRQSVTQVPGGPMILNPGTVGCPVFADIPSANRIEPRSPHARYAILTRRAGRWGAEMFALDYDWDRAAARALETGFPRWAEALATGSVTSD
jgi:putative phosphoesterase